MRDEEELEKHLNEKPDHCVFIHTADSFIFCYQCDLEITDKEPGYSNFKSILLKSRGGLGGCLPLRKLFADKLENKLLRIKGTTTVNTGVVERELPPLLSLLNVLVGLYSVDYLRKLFKKKSLANLYCIRNYGIKLLPNYVSDVCDGIFSLGRDNANKTVIEDIYASLIKEDPSISTYKYQNFHVS